jgi:peptidylprolyl isomerase
MSRIGAMPRLTSLLAVMCLSLVIASCGASSSGEGTAEATTTKVVRKEPNVSIPKGPPPKKLVVEELIPGTGAEIEEGDEAVIHYVMLSYQARSGIDSSWRRGKPFTFAFGSGEVVKGWERGMEGMRVGGRRKLIVPPSLGYGAEGSSIVSPEVTLVLVVDLLGVR